MYATFIQRISRLIEIEFQLGIGIVIFDKQLRRVFVHVQLTKILFQLGAHFNGCSTQRTCFSLLVSGVFLPSIQLNHMYATFIQRISRLTEIVFQLGIRIVIFDKRLRRVFVDVQLTKILFQLGIIEIGRVFVCEKLY